MLIESVTCCLTSIVYYSGYVFLTWLALFLLRELCVYARLRWIAYKLRIPYRYYPVAGNLRVFAPNQDSMRHFLGYLSDPAI